MQEVHSLVLKRPPACLSHCSCLTEATLFWAKEVQDLDKALAALPDSLVTLTLTVADVEFKVRSALGCALDSWLPAYAEVAQSVPSCARRTPVASR